MSLNVESTPQLHGNAKQIMEKSPECIDEILSNELLNLSVRDRNAINEELQESPEVIQRSLSELSIELHQIPEDNPAKAAYVESRIIPDSYVNTEDFRLRFLRCELFDAKKAAIRLVKFLNLAMALFGPKVLQHPMRVTDFHKEESKLLRTGNVQIMPFRDRSGRPIFTWVGDFGFEQGTIESRIKVSLYLFFAISDCLECQRKGVNMLIWVDSSPVTSVKPEWENIVYMNRLFEALPVRLSSTHFCLPDKPYFHMLRFGTAIAMGRSRISLEFHIGEDIELMYELKTYGIPVEFIPVTDTGNIKTSYFRQWIKARRHLENLRDKGDDTSSVIICPKSTDVIFRTGRSLVSHPGNLMFRNIIESKLQSHASAATKHEKKKITKVIIETIRQQQGRFLTWDAQGDWWTELEDASVIHTKVASSVKGLKKKSVGRTQESQSSTYAFQNQDNAKKRRKISPNNSDGSFSDNNSDCSCLF